MNISINYRNLEQYSINDYYNKDKSNFLPYLWTSSYGLQSLIKEKKSHFIIKKYITQVHSILDCFHKTDIQHKWLSDLSQLEKEFLHISVKEFKNIKLSIDEDELFIKHINKWIYSLIITSTHLKNPQYLYLASQFMITLVNNSNYLNLNDSDKIDCFITLAILLINLKQLLYHKIQIPTIKLYINLLTSMLENNSPRIIEYINNPNTLYITDPYEIGFLLESSLKLRLIIKYNIIDSKLLYKLYERLLKKSRISLNKIQFKTHSINNDAYKWYSLCIGLEAIKILNNYYINNKCVDKYYNNVKIISKYYGLKRNIIKNFKTYSYNKGNWNDCKDNNIVMFVNTEFPILSI